jgi:8-oxo-dGTP pyrophosphatase MutT (NUDIX family)
MELNHREVHTPPRAAASVVLLREGAEGLEVFLLKRHGMSDVLGGMYVFPGGKLDREDSHPETLQHLDTAPEALHAALAEPDLDVETAAGFFVAACRETFEESGVLLAAEASAEHAAAASEMSRAGFSFSELLEKMDLQLAASLITPWSRWITPRVPSLTNKRFDVRFFVARVPHDQVAAHDNRETTESVWLSPRVALTQYWAGEIGIAPPQIMSLAELSRYNTTAEVVDPAQRRWPRLIQPEPFEEDEIRVVAYPGDARHPLKDRAMPGPLRLVFRNKRFEPLGGFDEFFA